MQRGRGLIQSKSLPFKTLNNHNIYYSRGDGFLSTAKTIVDLVKDNSGLIKDGIAAVGAVKDTANAFSNTLDSYKQLQSIKKRNAERVKREEYTMTPEQLEKLTAVGSGFAKF